MYTLLKVRALETIACILILYILSSGMTRIANELKNVFFMVSINLFKILIKKVENTTKTTCDLQFLKCSIYCPYRKGVVILLNDELQIKLFHLLY